MACTWCSLSSFMLIYIAHVYGIWDMAEELEALGDVEFEGDPDLMIASRDFERIADARTNVSAKHGWIELSFTNQLCACAIDIGVSQEGNYDHLFCFRLGI